MKAPLIILSLLFAIFLATAPAGAADCVTVILFTEPAANPADGLVLMMEAVHCGSGFANATLSYSIERDDSVYAADTFQQLIPPGFVLTTEVPMPDPPLPAGTYRVCVVATIGTATDTFCGNATMDDAGKLTTFVPDNDLTPVDQLTWGSIKQLFR